MLAKKFCKKISPNKNLAKKRFCKKKFSLKKIFTEKKSCQNIVAKTKVVKNNFSKGINICNKKNFRTKIFFPKDIFNEKKVN